MRGGIRTFISSLSPQKNGSTIPIPLASMRPRFNGVLLRTASSRKCPSGISTAILMGMSLTSWGRMVAAGRLSQSPPHADQILEVVNLCQIV